jgi:hypothetical protein
MLVFRLMSMRIDMRGSGNYDGLLEVSQAFAVAA